MSHLQLPVTLVPGDLRASVLHRHPTQHVDTCMHTWTHTFTLNQITEPEGYYKTNAETFKFADSVILSAINKDK